MDSRFLTFFLLALVAAQAQNARVSFANTVADSPTQGLTFDLIPTSGQGNVGLNQTVTYRSFTDSFPVPVGSWNVSLLNNGVVVDHSTIAITVADGVEYTVAALGNAANAKVFQYTDDYTAPESSLYYRIRVINAVYNAPAFDVEINKVRVFNNTAFGDATGYLQLAAGTYDVVVFQAGSPTEVHRQQVTFVGGSVQNLYLEGPAVVNTTFLLDNLKTYQYVTARVAHFAVDVPTVDVYLGEYVIATSLSYKSVSDARTVVFAPANSTIYFKTPGTQTVLASAPVTVTADAQWLINALGPAANLKVNATLDDITPPQDATYGRIRLVHANFGVPAVNVIVNGAPFPAAQGITFGEITNPVAVPIGNYTILINSTGADGKTLIGPFTLTVSSGTNTVAYVAGFNLTDAVPVATTTVAYQYAFVRFAHLSLDAGAAQVVLTPNNISAAVVNTTTYSTLYFGNFSSDGSQYGYYPVLVTPSWTVSWVVNGQTTWLASTVVTVASQTYYTITLEGIGSAADPLTVGTLTDTLTYSSDGPQYAQIVFYNQVSQGTKGGKNINVDMYLDGIKKAENIAFSAQSPAFLLAYGSYVATFNLAGTNEAILSSPVTLGEDTLSGATGVVGIWLAGQYYNASNVENKVQVFVNSFDKYTQVRVGHAVTNAPAGPIAVYINTPISQVKIVDDIKFGTISNYYNFPTPAGSVVITLATAAGTFASLPYTPVVGDDLVYAYGYNGNASAPVSAKVVHDQFTVLPQGPNDFVIRFFHAVPFVGDAYLIWNGNNVSGKAIAYGEVTEWVVQAVNQVYRLDVEVGGQIVLTVANQTFTSGAVYEYILADYPTPRGFLVQEAVYTFFRFRAIHALVGAPAVTLNVDGRNVTDRALSYGEVSGYLYIESGARAISVILPSGQVFTSVNVNATTETYNLIISGPAVAQARVDFIQAEIVVPEAGSDAQVRVINADSQFPINVETTQNQTTFTNVPYLGQTEYIKVGRGLIPFEVQVGGNNGTKIVLERFTERLLEGASYTIFVLPNATAAAGQGTASIITEDFAPTPAVSIRFINALNQNVSVDQNAVAFSADESYIATVPYQSATGYVATAANSTITVRNNQQNVVLGRFGVTSSVNKAYTAYAYPVNGVVNFKAAEDNLALPADGKVRVWFINLIDGISSVAEVKMTASGKDDVIAFRDVAYGAGSANYTDVDQALYTITLTDVNKTQLASTPEVDLRSTASAVYTVAAVGTKDSWKSLSLLDAGTGYNPVTPSGSPKSSGLPGWAIALIVVGVILLIAAVAVAGWMIYKRRHAGYSTIPERDA